MKRMMVGILGSLLAVTASGGYTPLAYLEATGSQWIHTGYTPDCTDRVEAKVRFTSISSGFVYCARGNGVNCYSYSCVLLSGKFRLDHGASAQTSTTTAVAAQTDCVLMVNGATGASTLNYVSLGTVSTAAYQPAGPFALLASHVDGGDLKPNSSMANFVQGRLYYFRVYDKDGNLVRDFIPVRDDDAGEDSLQRYGMFDTVTGVFHPNYGTRAFTPGPEVGPEPHRMQRRIAVNEVVAENGAMKMSLSFANPGCAQRLFVARGDADGGNTTNGWARVEALDDIGIWEMSRTVTVPADATYLRFFAQPLIPGAKMVESLTSGGVNEYVDTGFQPDSNSCAEFRFKMLAMWGDFLSPFGSRNGGTSQFLTIASSANRWLFRFGNKSIDNATVGNPGVVGEHCFLLDRNMHIADGVARTVTMNTFSKAYNVYVFAHNNNNAASMFAPIDFHSLSLWDDGVLARAYVPCVKDDGTPALYDSVTGRFDVNQGATPLTVGAEAWSVSDLQAVGLTIPVRAEWTGHGTPGDFTDSDNWTCWNRRNEVLERVLPNADTEIMVKGTTTFNWPVGHTLVCRSIAFDCALAADADWCGLDSSRVVPGAKIDLAGHKLQVAELAFEGTISGKKDLTEPIAANVSSSSAFAYSSASCAFSDNFTWNDGSGRIMVAQASLPMELIYDFGEGNAKTVRYYRLYGNGPASAGRMPKNWTMQGSNDRLNWTLLDTRTEETGWTFDDNVRTYSLDNSASYRYYRMEFTATQAPDAAYLSFAQLEFFDGPIPVSELHVVVSEGVVAVNSSVKLNGSLKLVKEGAGTLRPAMSRQYYTGGTEVAEGTLQAGVDGDPAFGYGVVWVLADGTFDTNAHSGFHRMHFILDGGTLVNTGGGISVGISTFGWVTLTRNSQVKSIGGGMGGWWQLYDAPFLNLNGCTLDVAPEAYNIQFRGAGTITNGTIRVYGGLTTYNSTIEAGTVDFEFFKNLSLYTPITVRNLIVHDTIESISPITGTVMVKGTFTPETTKIPKVQLLDGSTFNLKAATEAWPATGDIAGGQVSFAEGARVTLDFGTRPLRSRQKVLTWEAEDKPVNIDTVRFHVKDRNYGVRVGEDGLYLFNNALVIYIR